MIVLASKTSHDKPSAAVFSAGGGSAFGGKDGFKVLSNVISSQIEPHKKDWHALPNNHPV
jgi:hypothetical protein